MLQMAGAISVFCCLSFCCMIFSASAVGYEACSETSHSSCAGISKSVEAEEGLELLQSSAKVVSKHGHQEGFEYYGQTIDAEMSILEDLQLEMVRFRANHEKWSDILELHKDGFFQRYHSHDAGVWHVEDNQLVLKWILGGADKMQSTDGGRSFNRRGGTALSLTSYVQPSWWHKTFKKAGAFIEVTHKEKAVAATIDEKAVVATHINGQNADLDEKGYKTVAFLKDNSQMKDYIRRVANSLKLKIANDGGLEGFAPHYSGDKAKQNLHKMMWELKKTAQMYPLKHRWVVEKFEK
mmetsp:Transcript_49577/g.89736  ORF Transcript_49577/g.89736 Transcript_49577/m.89736 type:complete len:295 (-) Transcript_49577:43-927(-)